MLYTKSVEPELLELLKFLMSKEIFNDFVLVGGTSLALQIGHRKSVDIDLFGQCEISQEEFMNELNQYGDVHLIKKNNNILIVSINGIKVDFVNYNYPLLKPILLIDGHRLASKEDIAAMKLNAIAGRGSKKDFIDIYYLFKEYSFDELLELYNAKYPDGSEFLVRKGILYFDDADAEISPELFNKIEWSEMKSEIIKKSNIH